MKLRNVFPISCFLICVSFISSVEQFNPGKERWPVKTSVVSFHPVKEISLHELLELPSPLQKYTKIDREEYQDERMPAEVGKHKLKEGDIITTYGYILLAAVEQDKNGTDGDYHVQIRLTPDWDDSCFIVEATYPPFIKRNNALHDSCTKVREFFDKNILKGRKKVCYGSDDALSPYVKITGQLFFDAHHLTTAPRGKQNSVTKEKMKSYTCWELHPIVSIAFARKQQGIYK